MFNAQLLEEASNLLMLCRSKSKKLACAESCTGGLISALFTEISGSSDVFERGFITYSNAAKVDLLNVPKETILKWGAVSSQVAKAMAKGALQNSRADLSISVTGIAGPGGGSAAKPVGLVYLASANKGGAITVQQCQFGDIGRTNVRLATVTAAVELLQKSLATQDS